jgi:hypothetical protein
MAAANKPVPKTTEPVLVIKLLEEGIELMISAALSEGGC